MIGANPGTDCKKQALDPENLRSDDTGHAAVAGLSSTVRHSQTPSQTRSRQQRT
jgi:hypothetical protein